MAECKEGCGRVARSRGMCSSHYRRWLAGLPLDTPIRGYQRYFGATRDTKKGRMGVVVQLPLGPRVRRLLGASLHSPENTPCSAL
jgi:hypothetical protein